MEGCDKGKRQEKEKNPLEKQKRDRSSRWCRDPQTWRGKQRALGGGGMVGQVESGQLVPKHQRAEDLA